MIQFGGHNTYLCAPLGFGAYKPRHGHAGDAFDGQFIKHRRVGAVMRCELSIVSL